MRVIGTAGHVDHGKSTLIKRLTGINPDRLIEEQAREMTIDLGFAWLPMPDGDIIGVVDVPGHRDFIENMLAGVGGIDAALLVIAADEGVMPQTREHLSILNLLGIENGMVALTKTDMIDDPDWLELVEQDVYDTLQNTVLANAPIVRVSAYTGDGIDDVVAHLASLLQDLPQRPDFGQPRLPIDRVFTISGFGTVVTGTLSGGTLQVGDDIELQPSGISGRVRGLQSYKTKVNAAYPGSRVAVNIAGIDKTDVQRGHVLAHPDNIRPSSLIDVQFHHLEDAGHALKHNAEVKFFSGTAETVAKVRLLNDDTLMPGETGWLQLRLSQPLPVLHRDRFIIRRPSPPQTIGGGIIVAPYPARRWKRHQSTVIRRLETLIMGTPAEQLAQSIEGNTPLNQQQILQRGVIDANALDATLQDGIASGTIVTVGDAYMAATSYHPLLAQIKATISDYHTRYPLRLGMPREELRSKLGIKNALLSTLIDEQPVVVIDGDILRHHDHAVQFSDAQQTAIDSLMRQMDSFTPPSTTDAINMVGDEVFHALLDLGELVRVQKDIIFSQKIYGQMLKTVVELIHREESIDAKTFRNALDTSRKYAIGFLEYTDKVGITKRDGDVRIRGKAFPS